MVGIRQVSQAIARGPRTTVLECHPDPLPEGYGITHRWEPYAANAEPGDTLNGVTLTYLKDLIGSADMVPNAMGATGATGPGYQLIGGQCALGFGAPRRLMTPLNRSQPHTIVAMIRPLAGGYTALSVFLGAQSTVGARGSVFFTSDGKWSMNAGVGLVNPAPVKGGQWQIVTAVFDGANSVLRIDGEEVTGNAGTEITDRLILGSFALLGGPTVCYMGPVYYAPVAWNAIQRAEFETWLRGINRLPFS